MNEQQLKTIVGLVAGMQTALVHLSNTLCAHTGITPDALAKSFEKSGEAIPDGVQNRELIQLVLRQVAGGIRSSDGRPVPDNVIRGLFE